jgi:hypothetical protein
MFKRKPYKVSAIRKGFLILIPVFIGFLAFAIQDNLPTKKEQPIVKSVAEEKISYDPVLLKKFEALTQKMDAIRDYSCSGSISAADHADSTEIIQNVPFEICKVGPRFYYRLGHTETINKPGMSLSIDHDAKKILIRTGSNGNQNSSFNPMKPEQLIQLFQSEEYQLKRSINGSIETLSLVNLKHISCKEYSVSIDTISRMPARFFTRLTNTDEPERTDNEKVIDVRITKWGNTSQIAQYTKTENKVIKEAGRWKAVGELAGYQVIQ